MIRADTVQAARLAAAIAQLPREQRAAFLAIAQEDASYATVAERLGTATAEVERLFAAALEQLDRMLERQAKPCQSQQRQCFFRRRQRR